MHDLAPCHYSKRTRTCLECNEIHVIKWQGNLPKNEFHRERKLWNKMKKDIGNQLLYLKEEMWKRVCEAWYSVAPTSWKKE